MDTGGKPLSGRLYNNILRVYLPTTSTGQNRTGKTGVILQEPDLWRIVHGPLSRQCTNYKFLNSSLGHPLIQSILYADKEFFILDTVTIIYII